MPTTLDLQGLGMASQLANVLGATSETITGVGTGQNGGAVIRHQLVELVTAGGATASTLSPMIRVGTPIYVYTSTATAGVVYVPTGHFLNGVVDASLSIATTKSTIFFQYKRGYWSAQAAA